MPDITVNGSNIISTESVIIDEHDALIASTESATMLDIMWKATESIYDNIEKNTNTIARHAGMHFIKGMGENVWETIINFFKNIAEYIYAFITGKSYQMRADAIIRKLKFTDGWKDKIIKLNNTDLKYYVSAKSKLLSLRKKIESVSDDKLRIDDESAKSEISRISKEVDELKQALDMAKRPGEITIGKALVDLGIGNDPVVVMKWLNLYSKGQLTAFKELNAEGRQARVNQTKAIAFEKNRVAKKDLILKYKATVKVQNAIVSMEINKINVALKVMNKI